MSVTYLDLLLSYKDKLLSLLGKYPEIFSPDHPIFNKLNTESLTTYIIYCKGFYNLISNQQKQGISIPKSVNYVSNLLGSQIIIPDKLCEDIYKLICEIHEIIISAEQ